MGEQNELLLTADEVAVKLRTSKFMVYELQRRGTFPNGVVVKVGRRTLFHAEKFREWLSNGGSLAKVEVAA